MTTLMYIRLIRVSSGLMFIGFLASSFFTPSITFVDKRPPVPVEYAWNGPEVYRSVLFVGPHEGMLLALMLMIGLLFFGIYLTSKLPESELERIGEDVKFYRGLRALKREHVASPFSYMGENFLDIIVSGLKTILIPGYLFQKIYFRVARVRKLDSRKEQVSAFGGHFVNLSVPADTKMIERHPGYERGTAHGYVRVSRRLYDHLKDGDTLPVFTQYHRHAPWMAKIRIAR